MTTIKLLHGGSDDPAAAAARKRNLFDWRLWVQKCFPRFALTEKDEEADEFWIVGIVDDEVRKFADEICKTTDKPVRNLIRGTGSYRPPQLLLGIHDKTALNRYTATDWRGWRP